MCWLSSSSSRSVVCLHHGSQRSALPSTVFRFCAFCPLTPFEEILSVTLWRSRGDGPAVSRHRTISYRTSEAYSELVCLRLRLHSPSRLRAPFSLKSELAVLVTIDATATFHSLGLSQAKDLRTRPTGSESSSCDRLSRNRVLMPLCAKTPEFRFRDAHASSSIEAHGNLPLPLPTPGPYLAACSCVDSHSHASQRSSFTLCIIQCVIPSSALGDVCWTELHSVRDARREG
ncbi:hypothetical protein MSAN_00830500 [Mycena sanguinolenta]|uniref:Uncharacterized protein n=1 Tax=Mycena sanguinolenta TaxID=230812 RepID=A0A8H6YV35_9AGAR|nr:hypothetical protein MSAN_00830500 [Mycena sanguinolenta]